MMMWKVMAGRGGRYVQSFTEKQCVAVALDAETDFTGCRSKDQVLDLVAERLPALTKRQVSVAASQWWRFLKELQIGDVVLVYEPQTRLYHLGTIAGEARFTQELVPEHPVIRPVTWKAQLERDRLSEQTKNSLGAILTIFRLPDAAAKEVQLVLAGSVEISLQNELDADVEADPFVGIEERAIERITDRINSLNWDEMQLLVASLLRALGYRTVISPEGPDRGKDIIASRDGFGFERPRIIVEVKHRRGQMGSQEIRSFLGGRHADDRGLYVSTGGFTKDARYEAERAATVTHLMTLGELAKAIVQQYDKLDEEGRRLLPLTKVYWPA